MGKKKGRSLKDQAWAEAKKRHRLAVRHVKMAREIGLNPKKLGKIDNHKQERWKNRCANTSSISTGSDSGKRS